MVADNALFQDTTIDENETSSEELLIYYLIYCEISNFFLFFCYLLDKTKACYAIANWLTSVIYVSIEIVPEAHLHTLTTKL